MRELLPLMAPFGNYKGIDPNERVPLGMLLTATARSTESAFLLMAYGQLWDAEIVIRSVFEGSLKFSYIVQTHSDFKQRFDDYVHKQFEVALIKDDQKARDLLTAIEDSTAPEWKPIRDRVLPDAERDILRAQYDKATRRAVETKWGYAALLNSLVKSGDAAYSGFAGLAHGYSIASHIQHADYIGVSIQLDREYRSPERRNAIHMAHLSRLISDCFTCFRLRLGAAYRFAGSDYSAFVEATQKIDALLKPMASAYKDWMDVEYGDQAGHAPAPS